MYLTEDRSVISVVRQYILQNENSIYCFDRVFRDDSIMLINDSHFKLKNSTQVYKLVLRDWASSY